MTKMGNFITYLLHISNISAHMHIRGFPERENQTFEKVERSNKS